MPRPKTDTTHLKHLLGRVDIHSTMPVYRQIQTVVRCGIASGTLKAGDRLPTVREMVEWLKVNHATVTKAYGDLKIMGLIWTGRGRGIFINQGVQGKCREKVRAEIIARLFEVCSEAKAAGMKAAEIKAVAKACYKAAGVPYGAVPKEIRAVVKSRK